MSDSDQWAFEQVVTGGGACEHRQNIQRELLQHAEW